MARLRINLPCETGEDLISMDPSRRRRASLRLFRHSLKMGAFGQDIIKAKDAADKYEQGQQRPQTWQPGWVKSAAA
jgi:hypothetical protein